MRSVDKRIEIKHGESALPRKLNRTKKKKRRDVQKKIEVTFSLQVFTHTNATNPLFGHHRKKFPAQIKNRVVAKNIEE